MSSEISFSTLPMLVRSRVRIGVTSDPMNTARGLHFTDEYEASDDVLAIPHRLIEERSRMT